MAYKASDSIKAKIKEFEGYRSEPYQDLKTGKMAVGYGDTDNAAVPLSRPEADRRFDSRVDLADRELSSVIKRTDLSQEKWDALVDQHYNMGLGKMSGVIAAVNMGDDKAAGDKMLEYVYSENVQTGQKELVPALQKRTAYRAQLWNTGNTEVSQARPTSMIQATYQNMMKDIDGMALEISRQETALPDSTLTADGYFMEEMDALAEQVGQQQQAIDEAPTSKKEMLDLASDSVQNENAAQWILRRKESERIAQRLGIPVEEARGILLGNTPEEILARNANATTAQIFPSTAKWGQNPDNYVLMQKSNMAPQKIEMKAKSLRTDSDFINQLISNKQIMQKNAIHAQMLMGAIDFNEAKNRLYELDQELKQLKPKKDQSARRGIEQSWNEVEKGFNEIGSGNIFGGSYDIVSNYMRVLAQYAGNADEYAGEIASSASSFAPTILATGGALALTNPATAALGYGALSSAGAMSLLQSFGGQMDEFLGAYTDSNGNIDYDKAFSDPERISRQRRSAGTYALLMAASDLVLGRAAGKIIGAAKTGVVSKIKKVAVASVVEEGGSEFIASSGASVSEGTFKKDLPANAAKALREATVSPGFMIAGATIGQGSVLAATKSKQAANKVLSKLKKASQATDKAKALKETRAEIKADQDVMEAKGAVDELITDTVKSPRAIETVYDEDGLPLPPTPDIGQEVTDAEMQAKADIDAEGIVLISPAEFDEYVTNAGFDPLVIAQNFTPATQNLYLKNKQSDTSFPVSLGEWLTFQNDDALDGIDDIARFPNIGISGAEAELDIDDVINDPVSFLQTGLPPIPTDEDMPPALPGQDLPPPIPGQDLPPPMPTEFIEATGPDGNAIMRPIQLISKFRNKTQQKLVTKILNGLKRASKDSKAIPKEALDFLAEMQYRHTQMRAEALNLTPEELSTLNFKSYAPAEGDKSIGKHIYSKTTERLPYGITRILLSPDANLSTITHELGHSWLHDMARDSAYVYGLPQEELTEIQSEYKRAMDATAKMFKIGRMDDILNMDDATQERIHETFAQTAEKYFLDGEFENNTIRKAMEAFRKYLYNIIHTIGTAYGKYPAFKITPEIEGIFETILGTSKKVDDAVMPLFDEPLFDPTMLGADGPKYMEAKQDAQDQAVAETYTKSFVQSERQRQQEADKRIKEFQAKAEASVDERPAFKLLKYFKEAYSEYAKTKEGTDPRLSYESVAQVLFNGDTRALDIFKEQIPMQIITGRKKGGMDVDVFMASAGITDPAALIEMIAESTNRDMRVDELVDKMIDEEIPRVKTDAQIHAIAEEAVQNKGKEKLLAMEMKILATKYLPTLKGFAEKLITPASYVSEEAKAQVEQEARTKVLSSAAYKFSPKNFLVDSNRKGRAAAKAFKANDIIAALDAKYNQIISFKAYLQAQAAYRKIAKGEKDAKKIAKYANSTEAAKVYDQGMLNQGRRIIYEAERGKVEHIPMSMINESSEVNPDMVKALNMAIDKYNSQSFEGPLLKNNVAARMAFADILNKVLRAASAAKRMEKLVDKLDLDQEATQAADEIMKFGKVLEYAPGTKRTNVTGARWLFETILGKDNYFSSVIFKNHIGVVTNAEGENAVEKRTVRKQIMDLYKPLIKKDPGFRAIINPLFRRTPEAIQKMVDKKLGVFEKPIAVAKLGVTWNNTGEMLMAMLHMGSESGSKAYLDRNTVKGDLVKYEAEIQRLADEGKITEDHINFLNGMWKIFKDMHPRVSKVMRDVDGFDIGDVGARSSSIMIKGKAFILEGGYAPISIDKELKSPVGEADLFSLDSHGMSAMGLYAQNVGLTKTRTEGAKPLELDISSLSAYTNAALNIIHMRQPLSNMRKLMLHPAMVNAMDTKAPGAVKNVIAPWWNRTLRQVYTEHSTDTKDIIARKARKGANMATYAFNTASGLRQLFGNLQTLRRVGPEYFSKAATQTMLQYKSVRNAVLKESAFMAERYDTSIKEGHRSIEKLDLNFDWVTWTDDKLQTVASFVSQSMQQYTDLVAWQASFLKALDDGMTKDQARNIADDTVMRTQGTMAASALSNIQSGTDVDKFIMMATNIPLINLNDLGLELNSDQGNKARAAGLASILAISISAPIILEEQIQEMIDSIFKEGEEEEDEESAATRSGIKIAGSTVSTVFPVWGRAIEGVVAFNKPSLGPGFSVVERVGVAAQGVKNIGRGVDTTPREARALLDLTTIVLGTPIFSMTGRVYKLNQDYIKSDEAKREDEYIRKYQLEDLRNAAY